MLKPLHSHFFQRNLQGLQPIDFLFEEDVCLNDDGTYSACDTSRFPTCPRDFPLICYNRRPRQDKFYSDTRQPYYFIDYTNVLCYPDWWGCSSCSPGRYCRSENRCILEEKDYPCEQWI